MHGMRLEINKHNVHDTNILLLNFYAFSEASRVTSLHFMNSFMSSASEAQHATTFIAQNIGLCSIC